MSCGASSFSVARKKRAQMIAPSPPVSTGEGRVDGNGVKALRLDGMAIDYGLTHVPTCSALKAFVTLLKSTNRTMRVATKLSGLLFVTRWVTQSETYD